MKHTTSARIGQGISGAVLLLIAMTAGATGFYINVSHGLEVSNTAGIIFGLSDLAKISLPIVAGVIGWSFQTRITATVCVAFSLFCAYNAYTGSSSQILAGKQHGANQYSIAQSTVKSLETEVAKLDADARAEAARGGCGKQCKFLMERADSARISLTEARTSLRQAKPVSIDRNAETKATVTALAFLFLLESLVWLSVPAMAALRIAAQKPEPKIEIKPAKKATKRKPRATKKTPTAKQKAAKTFDQAFGAYSKGKIDKRTVAGRSIKKAANVNVGKPANVNA